MLYSQSGPIKDGFNAPRGLLSGEEPFVYLAKWEDLQICIITGSPNGSHGKLYQS
jgi:hypothetical protein